MPSLDIKIAGEEPAVPQILKIDAIWVVAVQVATETLESSTEKAGFCSFTLVEIVAVLVLLGILAAVAVPKFFDLSSDAEKKAAEAALMEAQVRINAGYSKAVYAGSTCVIRHDIVPTKRHEN